jgi:hypothetical protein
MGGYVTRYGRESRNKLAGEPSVVAAIGFGMLNEGYDRRHNDHRNKRETDKKINHTM